MLTEREVLRLAGDGGNIPARSMEVIGETGRGMLLGLADRHLKRWEDVDWLDPETRRVALASSRGVALALGMRLERANMAAGDG